MDTVVRDEKFRHKETEVELVADLLIAIGSTNECMKGLEAREFIIETLNQAGESGVLRTWYDKEDKLVGLLLFQVFNDWWTKEAIVKEELILTVNKGYAGLQRLAMKELERIARSYDSRLIVSGNLIAPNQKVVENGYRKQGYQHKSSMFMKRLKGEQDGLPESC